MRELTLYYVPVAADALRQLLCACPCLTRPFIHGELAGLNQVPIGTYCPSLEEFTFFGCALGTACDVVLQDIGAHCARLRQLCFPHGRFGTGAGLVSIAQNCPLLEDVELSRSEGIPATFPSHWQGMHGICSTFTCRTAREHLMSTQWRQ
jgi:hypothetical protein